MAQTAGPWTVAKECAKPSLSRLSTMLMSFWRNSRTSFERWRAATVKPSPSSNSFRRSLSAPVVGEFHEFDALDLRRRRQRRDAGDGGQAVADALAVEGFAGDLQGTHAVAGDRTRRGAAELVVEDFDRDRLRDSRCARRRRDRCRSGIRPGPGSSDGGVTATSGPSPWTAHRPAGRGRSCPAAVWRSARSGSSARRCGTSRGRCRDWADPPSRRSVQALVQSLTWRPQASAS